MEKGKENKVLLGDAGDMNINDPNKCKEFFKKHKKLFIVIASVIVIVLILFFLIYFLLKKSNKKEEEFKKNNTLKLIYYNSEEGVDITLFSSKIISLISSLVIDGKEKEQINNYYTFNIIGEHTININLKTNLVSLSEMFKYNS